MKTFELKANYRNFNAYSIGIDESEWYKIEAETKKEAVKKLTLRLNQNNISIHGIWSKYGNKNLY